MNWWRPVFSLSHSHHISIKATPKKNIKPAHSSMCGWGSKWSVIKSQKDWSLQTVMLKHWCENGLWHKMSLNYCLCPNCNLTISMPKAVQNCISRPCRLYLDRLYNFSLLMLFTPFLNLSERRQKRTWVSGARQKMATTLSSVVDWQFLHEDIIESITIFDIREQSNDIKKV